LIFHPNFDPRNLWLSTKFQYAFKKIFHLQKDTKNGSLGPLPKENEKLSKNPVKTFIFCKWQKARNKIFLENQIETNLNLGFEFLHKYNFAVFFIFV